MKSLHILMRGVIDYAGLFPPAELNMKTAVDNYQRYRSGEDSWILGRFIVPVSRLDEFDDAAAPILGGELEPWRLSALIGEDPAADLKRIAEFNRVPAVGRVVDTVEVKTPNPGAVAAVVPESLDCYFEVPAAEDPSALVRAIATAGRKAKLRTGGVSSGAFPAVADVSRFLDVCRREDVAFKATAGLHHALRAEYPLTYAAKSKGTTMHGFLNVFLAACFRHAGATLADIEAILNVTAGDALEFDESGITCGAQRITNDGIESARSRFGVSFGSCSFEEPIDELRGMQLL